MELLYADYFSKLPEPLQNAIGDCKQVLDLLSNLNSTLGKLLASKDSCYQHLPTGVRLNFDNHLEFDTLSKFENDFYNQQAQIFIGKGSIVEKGTIIKPYCYIGNNCQLRQSSYLREECFIGNCCVIGHCTEIKQSIVLEHSEAGHFNYIGNSIIGNYVNLGAGAKLANLEFRSIELKQKQAFRNIRLPEPIRKRQFTKLGAIIGDGSEIGCNAVLSPGTFLGQNCRVLPNICVPKGIYKARQKISLQSAP